jgi:hypothetical protein
MMGEVTGFDQTVVIGVYVAAPNTEAYRIFGINVSILAIS